MALCWVLVQRVEYKTPPPIQAVSNNFHCFRGLRPLSRKMFEGLAARLPSGPTSEIAASDPVLEAGQQLTVCL